MKFNELDLAFLKGEKFSNGRKFKIAEKNQPNKKRVDYLIDKTAGTKIIHIGFTDHIPLILDKVNKNEWLHGLFMKSCERCVGIDINADAIQFVKEELKIEDVFCINVEKDQVPSEITNEKFDYLVLGEVLEHIDNPTLFLASIREKFKPFVSEIIITVPNAFDIANIDEIKNNNEFINTDHRYWFTPFTLAKVLNQAGYETNEFHFSQTYMPSGFLKKRKLMRFPMLRETLIMTAKL